MFERVVEYVVVTILTVSCMLYLVAVVIWAISPMWER